jgi:type IV pilus assembly protein PilP
MKNQGNQRNRWMILVCTVLVMLISSCEKPAKKESRQPSSPVVSKSIHQQQPSEKSTDPKKAVSPPASAVNLTVSTPADPSGEKIPVKNDKNLQNEDKKIPGQVPETLVKLEQAGMAATLSFTDTAIREYAAKSALDPFKPLIQEKKETSAPEIQKPNKPLRILTPLEKMELSQIKLVAVVIMEDRKIAMVEDATGKGYEVGIGTYMGKNEGQVMQIAFDSIVVKEIATDYKGNETARLQEIKLHKDDNGE